MAESELLTTCLLAGRIMIESGAEMYRVDDTMTRIAHNGGEAAAVVFTTPTGLFIGSEHSPLVKLGTIRKRTIDMEKVMRVNALSRRFAAGECSLHELHEALIGIDANTPTFPLWLQVVAAAVCSALLMVLFAQQNDWRDLPLAAVAGGAGFYAFAWLDRVTRVQFISSVAGAFVVAALAWLGVRIGIGRSLDNIIIGAVMPLVPGVAITNSIRDMLAGHLVSGMVRGMEAILSAAAIGVGVAVIFRFF
ncbi:threonine/serine exporter family protein [Lacticaseibacillus nasuensis]|uniref:Threonine/serine exporter-like N-terminal domain-containing protein n=1 Tax=Lacticaseibacillus nasuensis JCM 17158 TaxID=1291734 RepID=A0A0R1JZR5_9LACO|nr:threonine/serine exporter family protein [Lacticaseibacillus nasuensis]KRK74068.1 hypothetical protein FD02_GL001391 [Lacticaseibacillus nasuensis JCM 17158]